MKCIITNIDYKDVHDAFIVDTNNINIDQVIEYLINHSTRCCYSRIKDYKRCEIKIDTDIYKQIPRYGKDAGKLILKCRMFCYKFFYVPNFEDEYDYVDFTLISTNAIVPEKIIWF